jgi:hypothetical protein
VRIEADDFGCVADGRILDRVTIDAGSVVLNAPRGGLRPGDVGKSVAIPGAVDLVETVAALVDHRQVRDASIDLAQPDVLRGTPFDPAKPAGQQDEAFVADVHEGQRITVAGAGSSGNTLLTDVAEVLDATAIRLAVPAAVAVDGVEVILNDPGVVTLSNYARRSVSGLTVDLGDRTIDDAQMVLGGRGLRSDTARFSSLDLTTPPKQVTILAAGLFVTTIQSVETPKRARLAEPAQRSVTDEDLVVADVWRTDSRPGLELLLAAIRGHPQIEAADIRFGPGVYDFTRPPPGEGAVPAAIALRGLTDVTLRGAGQGVTVLRLMPGQQLTTDSHVIETLDCTRLTLRDLSVHGAYLTLGNAVEQMHGINVNAGSKEITVLQVRVFQSAGDGIRFLGRSGEQTVGKVWVEGCRFIQNKRTGVAFQRGVEFVWVRDCYIEMTAPSTDQCIDFEPSRLGDEIVAPRDVFLESNVLVHASRSVAVAISGVRGIDPTRRVVFAGNVVRGGEIFCTDVAELTIRDNIMFIPASARPGRIILNLQRGGDTVLIQDNLLLSEHPETRGAINLSEVNNRQVTHARVVGNICVIPGGPLADPDARKPHGIQVTGSDDVAVEGNMLVSNGACSAGVRVHSETSGVNDVSVRGNDITALGSGSWETGILFVAGQEPIHHVSAVGNSFRGATAGVEFRGNTFTQTPVCALNRADSDVGRPFAGLQQLPQQAMVVGGGASRGGTSPVSGAGRFLVGVGDPNDSGVPGNVGDVYQRLDQDPQNPVPTLYVKESGDNTPTGWAPK